MQTAEKISVTMTPEMLRLIRESVDAGDYDPLARRCGTR
jgi:antitoxin ParD1/3/4